MKNVLFIEIVLFSPEWAHLTVGDAKGFARGVETRSVFEFRFFFVVACTLIGARFRKSHFGPSPHFCTVYLMWAGRANLQRNRANYGHLGW